MTLSWEAFLRTQDEQREMLIPGLLGFQDRLVLTGGGGLGKSTLLQQIAVCAAAGVPPFDWQSDDGYTPLRVSIMDWENPGYRVKTRLWPLVKGVTELGADPRPNLTLSRLCGQGFDLLNARNQLSLLRTVEHDAPQLLYLGPVYKMHNDDPDKESVVKRITAVLDQVRALGVAIITEAHPNKGAKTGGSLEPSGSNLWTWWPEFGLGMRASTDPDAAEMRRCVLERWRMDREIAQWPDQVETSGNPGLPWVRAAAPGFDAARYAPTTVSPPAPAQQRIPDGW